ncbi:MAG TPA: DUF433 domain-containing protein [Candidatus Kapabacteria bacterium]|nr:DUF433 domain-containing protein [Candidatus Kapabacteria bacterium]
MNKPRIICDPNILVGKPTIEGTRISVELVLEEIAFHSVEEMLAEYPSLSREGIQAALEYATGVIRNEDVMPVFVNYE